MRFIHCENLALWKCAEILSKHAYEDKRETRVIDDAYPVINQTLKSVKRRPSHGTLRMEMCPKQSNIIVEGYDSVLSISQMSVTSVSDTYGQ